MEYYNGHYSSCKANLVCNYQLQPLSRDAVEAGLNRYIDLNRNWGESHIAFQVTYLLQLGIY
jgi:hypothetical protein